MSFIGGGKGVGYEPGYFLAHEECTRETREFKQDSPLVKTSVKGGKYVPMGTAYPTNDASAIGITYEDVDVTFGNMAGSVVTVGTVDEDKLAITGQTYDAVTPTGDENPSDEGWYEKSGDVYNPSTDTTVDSGKTYYEVASVTRLDAAAKTALEGLGFRFVKESEIVRPDFD